jgi:hypothetical protein
MKAKDLRGKNLSEARASALEDVEEGVNAPEEEDAVAAAYENISKKLDSIRNGKDDSGDDEEESKKGDDEEIELEEWKGPKPPARDVEIEEEEVDIRKVKLRNLEDANDKESEVEDEEQESSKVVKRDWEPKENDPLDDEEAGDADEPGVANEPEADLEKEEMIEQKIKNEEDLDSEESDSGDIKNEDEMEEDNSSNLRTAVPESDLDEVESEADVPARKDPQPDTLDDLAEMKGHRPMAGGLEDEEEYDIPNLKPSRQEGSNLSYNTHPQREGLGQSYSPKGSYMDGNDPNNFFSQHQQPQAPKRANKFHLLVLVLIGIAVIGFTVYILKGGFGQISMTSQPSPSPSAAPTTEPTPTPTPEPEIERGNFTVKVLNGTTTSGLAGKIRDKLKELGYKTATPGNNSDTDVAQTEIRVKEGTASASLFERLKLDLAPDYDATQGENLDSKSANDAEVIIGAK